ncbi:hypothetical protein GH714_007189 [Hevea brasiliensis]|uniref:RNA-dependent RNA polymerase n=1 Tax=Hevea brasiliensis TaxID=3981 RepID=A0A6A6LW19_HEVBR|nr:hypothetical protein GH714_007189 [Hevea brasiliensis]
MSQTACYATFQKILITFCLSLVDEELGKIHSTDLSPRASENKERRTAIYKRFLSILQNGIVIDKKRFEFLAFSSSQLRENSCWMFASRYGLTADIREWMGNFRQIRNVAKYAARLGQSFSSSTETLTVSRNEMEIIPDVEIERGRTKYLFSDGIGKISAEFATKTKTRIFLPNGRSMMGCLDETRTLEYGQVFVQFSGTRHRQLYDSSLVFGGYGSHQNFVIEGKVVVAKNPCLHPGDVRVLRAVNVPALHHMVDCVVFPQKGPRPHPNECSGSDLDGDIYFVCWDPNLIPDQQIPPVDYTPEPTVQLDHDVTIENVIGKLFREVRHIGPPTSSIKSFTLEVARQCYDPDMEVDGFEDYKDDAFYYKSNYDYKLGNYMDYYGIRTEAEILSGNIMKMSKAFTKRRDAEAIAMAVRSLRNEAKSWFYEKGSGLDSVAHDVYAKASAWYHVTYHPSFWGCYNEGMKQIIFLASMVCL